MLIVIDSSREHLCVLRKYLESISWDCIISGSLNQSEAIKTKEVLEIIWKTLVDAGCDSVFPKYLYDDCANIDVKMVRIPNAKRH